MHLITTKIRLLTLILFTNAAAAQSIFQPSIDSAERKSLIDFYDSFRADANPIFNGREYERYSFYLNKGIPFFMSDTMTLGSVVYDGMLYNNVELMYDMILDELTLGDIPAKIWSGWLNRKWIVFTCMEKNSS